MVGRRRLCGFDIPSGISSRSLEFSENQIESGTVDIDSFGGNSVSNTENSDATKIGVSDFKGQSKTGYTPPSPNSPPHNWGRLFRGPHTLPAR